MLMELADKISNLTKVCPGNPQVNGRQENEIFPDTPGTEYGGRPALERCI
jgi:hypothetical protein